MIGQDQDSNKAGTTIEDKLGFVVRDAHKGILTEVNIWNRILCYYEIVQVSRECGPLIKGNYRSYNDFKMSPTVQYIIPACCTPRPCGNTACSPQSTAYTDETTNMQPQ